ncbi:MAG: xanthine dehydrogenase family protein [Alphaproteobacteria bacterium]|nr:xanthine dehydrogenase family protein [Alphaproteobacteria bacterium]
MTQISDGGGPDNRSVRRVEDRRLLTGQGRFTDDDAPAGAVVAVFLRSPHAHARIRAIDAAPALTRPGVLAVVTGRDLAAAGVGGLACGWQVADRDGRPMVEPPRPLLASERVRHVGDPVAVVLAETAAIGLDALESIVVDYEALPAVTDAAAAVAPGAPQVWPEAPGNLCCPWEIGDAAAVARAFAAAAHVVPIELRNNRLVAAPMEPRAAVASFDAALERYTLVTTTQNPHAVRATLAGSVLGIPEHRLQVICRDVGGGFGTKIFIYPEEAVITWCAGRFRRPVRWTASRIESFQVDAQGRDHVTRAELALDADGGFLGLRVRTLANLGAYLTQAAPGIATFYYAQLLSGVYRIPAIHCEVRLVFTNTTSVDAYRGAGRPEATYVLERLVDKAARATGIDRFALRRRNFIPEEAYPYATPLGLTYDSGNHARTLDIALAAARPVPSPAAAHGSRRRGFGVSTYVEIAGARPTRVTRAQGSRGGRSESALVRVHPSGAVSVFTPMQSNGQGHETTFAQLVADRLGVPMDMVEIVEGDTDRVPFGRGSAASRSLVVGGSAIAKAVDRIAEKARRIAAHMLGCRLEDVILADGRCTDRTGGRSATFAQVARAAHDAVAFPVEEIEPGLEATAFYEPVDWSYPCGCHACEVEVDVETGVVRLLRVIAVDDVGNVINPMIVHGQIHGGLAQGIGQALLEHCRYDPETGQNVTSSLMDYALPRADDLPSFDVHLSPTVCLNNPLGAKGCAEVGSVGVPPAVVNAVLDALAPLGVEHLEMPLTPERVWRAIADARERSSTRAAPERVANLVE